MGVRFCSVLFNGNCHIDVQSIVCSALQIDRQRSTSSHIVYSLFCFNDNSVTRNYFENLVRALENGLSDVDSHAACSRTVSAKSVGATSSKGKAGKCKATTSRSSSSNRNMDDLGHWSCDHCTFANLRSATICQMCQHRR